MADEVDKQFGLDSVVKEVLANATVMDSTPGPVNVSGEEGWTSMSLLYIDPNGDLFLKEQQNQPVTWDGKSITIGATNGDYITIDNTTIKFFKDSDTEKGSLSGDTWTLGTSTSYHTSITNTAVQLKNGSTILTEITGDNAIFGEVGSSKSNVYISSGEIQLRTNTTPYIKLSNAGVILVGEEESAKGNVYISSGQIDLRVNTTSHMILTTAGVLTVGNTTAEHVYIDSDKVSIKNGSTVLTNIEAGVITLGATSSEYTKISGTGFQFFDGSTERFRIDVPSNDLIFYGDAGEAFFSVQQADSSGDPFINLDATALASDGDAHMSLQSNLDTIFTLSADEDNNNTGDARITFRIGTAAKAGIYVDASESDVFKIESDQSRIELSNAAKRIDLENTDIFSIADTSSPVSPGANHSGLVSKSGKLYAVDSGGNETQLTP